MRALVNATVFLDGLALHSGRHVRARVVPATTPGSGVVFRRCDLKPAALVAASLEACLPASRRLLLDDHGVRVSTPEHLLAALAGLGICDATVDLWGDELPFLDGSAAPFAEALWDASAPAPVGAPSFSTAWHVVKSFGLHRDGAACRLVPDDGLRLTASLDFGPAAALRPQRLSWCAGDPWSFARRLAPARSFGFVDDATALRSRGLARGARLRNVLVYGARGPLNAEGTRFRDEAVRHNLLDALGATMLLGASAFRGRLILDRCGHGLVVATLRAAIAEGALRRRC